MTSVGLVSCGRRKLEHPAPARELYTGSLFRAAARYASGAYDEWWVLSALHGLVHPNTVLAPYDHTMADYAAWQTRLWGRAVEERLRAEPFDPALHPTGIGARMIAGESFDIYLHAGRAYRDPVMARTSRWRRATVHVPLDGLSLGHQLAWYAHRANTMDAPGPKPAPQHSGAASSRSTNGPAPALKDPSNRRPGPRTQP